MIAKYNVTSAYSTFKTNIIGNLLELSPAFASFYEQNETSLTQFENKVLGLTAYFDTFISTMDTIRNVKGAYTDIINSFTLLKTTGIETFTALKGNIVTSITRMATFGLTSLTAIGTYISTLITATAAQYGFNLAISLNPIGLAVAAILAIGVAVYELVTHWETVKAWINNFSKWVWEHHPFKFVFDLIDKVFPQFKVALNGIWDYTKGLFDKLWNWFAEKLQWIKDMISGFTSSPIEIKATANVSNLITDVTQQAYDLLHSKDLATGTDKGLGIQNKLDKESVKGNDKKIVNVSIKIDKLNEGGINIITNNFRESEGQLKAFFERMLLDAVNQANYAY